MKSFYVFFLLIFCNYILFSQCESDFSVWQKIAKIDTISDDNLIIKKINEIKVNKEVCNQTQDSVYAKTLHILGRTYWHLNDINNAIKFSLKSIEINSKNNNHASKRQSGLTLYNLGEIYLYNLQNYKQSIFYYDKCISILEKYNFRKDLTTISFSAKASIYFSIGDYQKSIENADKGLVLLGPEITIEKVVAVSEKIQSLIELKKFSTSFELLNFYIKYSEKKFKNSRELANLYSLMGTLQFKRKNYTLAYKYFTKALKNHQFNNYNNGSAQTLITIGDLLIENEKHLEAFNVLKNSLKYSKEVPYMGLDANTKISFLYSQQKQFEKALGAIQIGIFNYLKINLNASIINNPKPEQIKFLDAKEFLYRAMNNKAETWLAYYHHTNKKEYLQNALATFEVADKMVDYMRQEHVGYQSKLFWRDKTHQLYENAIEVCYLLKNYEKAFYFFEKSRAVLLNDKINNLAANQLLSDADQLKERHFQQQTAELNAKLEQSQNDTERSKINLKLLDIQEAQQTFLKNIAQKYPSYYRLKYDTTMYNLASMKAYLKQRNTSFIEYFKGDSAQYQLIIRPSGVELFKQKLTENVFQRISEAQGLGSRIIVSQDGDFVPLDTLKSNNGQYLLQKYAISYTYSAQYLLKNAETIPQKSYFNNFIGFAPVNYAKSMALPVLFGADGALKKVSGNFWGNKTFTHEAATKANFTKNISDYKIIQLFTHADADNINKEPTIFFADSAFKVSDLEGLKKINAELLVLSACKTNVGKIVKGEGTLSMAREFAGLGIPASITTLWSVENEATYLITELFYKYLKQGKPKDIALQKAKIEYLTLCSREKQAPIYWSGFVLVGETDPIIMEDTPKYAFMILFLIIIVAVLVYSRYRKPFIIK